MPNMENSRWENNEGRIIKKNLQRQLGDMPSDWLTGIFLRKEGNKYIISFMHTYFKQWFFINKKSLFEKGLQKIAGKDLNPDHDIFYGDVVINAANEQDINLNPVLTHASYVRQNSHVPDTLQSNGISNPNRNFNNFIINNKNNAIVEFVKKFIERKEINPAKIVLCGSSGSGKSHLLNAIYQEYLRIGKYAILRSADPFCLNDRLFLKMRFNFLASVLIIDDLHVLINYPHIQENLVNFLEQAGTRGLESVIFGFTGRILNLKQLQKRLLTRLENSFTFELADADLDLRLQYLDYANKAEQLNLTRDIKMFLARRAQSIAGLKGILEKIKISFSHTPPALSDIEALTQTQKTGGDWRSILKLISRRLEVKPEEILGVSRKPELVLARQIAMYLCRKCLGFSYPELGKIFGGKDHSTAMHSIKKIQKLRTDNGDMHKFITELENQLQVMNN